MTFNYTESVQEWKVKTFTLDCKANICRERFKSPEHCILWVHRELASNLHLTTLQKETRFLLQVSLAQWWILIICFMGSGLCGCNYIQCIGTNPVCIFKQSNIYHRLPFSPLYLCCTAPRTRYNHAPSRKS